MPIFAPMALCRWRSSTRMSYAYAATIDLAPFVPGPAADVWTFDATNYVWETSTVPYHAGPDLAPTRAVTCGASASTPFTFAPASITVIRFAPPGGSLAVVADAGDPPQTTGAPVDAGVSGTVLIDNMSSTGGAEIQLVPQHSGDVAGIGTRTSGEAQGRPTSVRSPRSRRASSWTEARRGSPIPR